MKQRGSEPLGIFLNNPGNLEWGSPWQGMVARENSYYHLTGNSQQRRFIQFKAPAWGIRAIARTLIAYYDKYGITTIRGAISRWAPSVENNTTSYIIRVAQAVGVSADERLDFHNYEILRPMVEAIIRHENGVGPLRNANLWYPDNVIEEAMRLAGVVPGGKKDINSKQGVAAGAAVAAGSAAVVAEIVQQVAPIAAHVQGVTNATEGMPQWMRLVVICLTLVAVGASAWILWSRRAGKVEL